MYTYVCTCTCRWAAVASLVFMLNTSCFHQELVLNFLADSSRMQGLELIIVHVHVYLRDTVVHACSHTYVPFGVWLQSQLSFCCLLQSSGGVKSLSLPVGDRVLSAIIEYMYTDEAPSVQGDD